MKFTAHTDMQHSPSIILRVLLPSILALVALIPAACSKKADPASIQAKADDYFKAGKYDEAKIEYMNLLRADRQNAAAYRQVGTIWYEQGAPIQAIPFLLKSLDLAPGRTDVRTKLAYALLSIGELPAARKETLTILEQVPSSDEGILLLAETAATQKDVDATYQELEKRKDPDRAAVHLASATLAARTRKLDLAEEEVKKALALDPKMIAAHLAMANLYLAKTDAVSAGEQMKIAADLAPLRAPARFKLVEFKLDFGDVEEAKAMLKEMTVKTRDYLPAWRLLAQLALSEKKPDEALTLLENIFARDSNNIEARMLQAQILASKGETKKTIDLLEKLKAAYPTVPTIQLRLAQAYLQDQNTIQAGVVLNELLSAHPDYVDALLVQAEVKLRAGEAQIVVDMMTKILERRDGLLQAELLLAEAYRALGRFDDAAAIFRKQIAAAPKTAQPRFKQGTSGEGISSPATRRIAAPHYMLGMVLRQKGSNQEAKAAFEKAQELAPENFQATEQLIELDILTKDLSAALRRVQTLIEKKPDSGAAHFLAGKIYVTQSDWAQAEKALLKAVELEPEQSRAYDLLISTYAAAGNLPEAINRLEARLIKKPDDLSALLAIAVLYEKTKAFPKARDAYEKILAKNPEFVPALNNLAVLYTDQFNQLDKATELARKARTVQPDEPSVADTLGWILYKRADYSQALSLFSESAQKMPDNPEVLFHLGMANYMMGKTEAARTALEKAVASPDDFPGKEEARKRLALLGSDSGKTGQIPVQELEALVKAQPNDLVTRVRLGEAYEAQSEFPKAAATYEEALKLNPKLVPAMLKLAQLNLGPVPNPAKALELVKKARAVAPNDPKVSEILGRASYQTGNFPFAYSLLQESLRQPAVESGLLHDFAWAAYSIGKVAQAQETMQRLLKEAPESPDAGDAKTFLAMTAVTETNKDLPAAEPEVQKILAAKPDYLPAKMVRAALQTQRGDSKAAETTYTEILGKLPEFAPAQKELAALYLGTPANRDKAYTMALKAQKNLPGDPVLARTLAELSYHRKDYANAIQFFQESANKQPLDATGNYYLGLAYVQTKDKTKASAALKNALDAGLKEPMTADAKRALGELAK